MVSPPATRRHALSVVGGLAVLGCANRSTGASAATGLADLEAKSGGRLGVFIVGPNGETFGHRNGERFGLCSTFKLPLAAVVLREVDAGRLMLGQWIPYSREDMVFHAPVTEPNLEKGGMTVGELAEAAQVTSDNVAANLLLKLLGGPRGFTEKLRELGDRVTRLDRFEPEMNFVPMGEARDTTTPEAMARITARIFAGDLLSPASRDRLAGWTVDTKTGLERLRKGLPAGWRAGDKTGTASAMGMPNKHNDVAIVWLPQGGVSVIAAYYEAPAHFEQVRPEDNGVLSKVGAIAARVL